MSNANVFCYNCKNLKTDGPCDQWYYYCALDEDKCWSERITSWYKRAGNEHMRDMLDGTCKDAEARSGKVRELASMLKKRGARYDLVGRTPHSGDEMVVVRFGNMKYIEVSETKDGMLRIEGSLPGLSPEGVVRLLEVLQ